MKRIMFFAIILCVAAGFAFGQSYTVQSVTGRVEKDSGGQRVAVKTGDSLDAAAVIYTGIGASLVLAQGEKTYTVPAARNGKVTDLAAASSGVRIGGNVARVETGAVNRTTAQIGTASARASDAARNEDFAAE